MAFQDPFFVSLYEQIDGTRTVDRAFYLEQARLANGPILDLGCGSGRLLLPMLEAGHEVVGLDSSEAMLDKLRSSGDRFSPVLLHSAFEDLDVDALLKIHDGYDLIICAFNSFLHLINQESQLAFLKRIRPLLTSSGRFILDFVNPCSHEMFATAETERELEHRYYDEATGESIESWLTIKQDIIEQTGALHREYEITSPDGEVEERTSVVRYRWTYPSEMNLLLKLAGFVEVKVYGDYAFGPLTEETDEQIWIVR